MLMFNRFCVKFQYAYFFFNNFNDSFSVFRHGIMLMSVLMVKVLSLRKICFSLSR